MAGELLPWTTSQVNQFIELVQLHGSTKPLPELMQQIGFPPGEIPGRVAQAWTQLGQKAAADHRAVEILSQFAEQFPAARDQLMTVTKLGGRNADVAFRALDALAKTRPNDVVPLLQRLVQAGAGYATESVQLLGTMARQGNAAARQALVEIEKNPGAYTAALSAAARALLAAMTAVSTTALIAGAVILVGISLVGGYIWSQSGDQPIPDGPGPNRKPPTVTGPTTRFGPADLVGVLDRDLGVAGPNVVPDRSVDQRVWSRWRHADIGSIIQIDAEQLELVGGGDVIRAVDRGVNGTAAQAHAKGASIYMVKEAPDR